MVNPAPAVAFLNELGRPPWTLAAWKVRNGKWLDTQICRTNQEAAAFISKHSEHMIRFLLGYSRNPVTKVPKLGDLIMSFGVAMAVPIDKLPALGVCPPTAWIEGKDHGIALWRYVIPMNANAAWLALKAFATRFSEENGDCRVEELPLMIPLPYVNDRFDLVFHNKRRTIDSLSFTAGQPKLAKSQPKDDDNAFVRGDQAKVVRGLPIIKKGWVPGDAITLFLGPPKQGKSLGVAKLASYITSGGSWETGGWREGWWDGTPVLSEARGSVIICEEEDPRLETLARLRAAGCDMSKVHVRVTVPDISVPKQLKLVTDIADENGDCRMISFSPFSRALRLRAYTEDAVRDKITPIQAWIRGKGICVIAIVHLDQGGRQSGSQVIPRVCRSGISFNEGEMGVALSNSARMGVKMNFTVEETTVLIDGVKVDTGRIILR